MAALPELRVAQRWEAPLTRSRNEVDWLDEAAQIVPEAIPRVLFRDSASAMYAMEFLDLPVWKDILKAGIVDGPATDFSEIRRVEMPMWCRGPSPITTKILGLEGAINVPVTVGGQVVEPGDAILADESGVIVLNPAEAKAVAEALEELRSMEVRVSESGHERISGRRHDDLVLALSLAWWRASREAGVV